MSMLGFNVPARWTYSHSGATFDNVITLPTNVAAGGFTLVVIDEIVIAYNGASASTFNVTYTDNDTAATYTIAIQSTTTNTLAQTLILAFPLGFPTFAGDGGTPAKSTRSPFTAQPTISVTGAAATSIDVWILYHFDKPSYDTN